MAATNTSLPSNAKLPPAHGPVPSQRQLLWHERELYGFIHFTINTFTGREWGYGDEDPSIFNPTELDCRQWVQAAKAGGLSALILTAKHHDGFCLWPTETTAHSIKRSPFRNGHGDVVGELAQACREAGLGLGIYCSPWDRNHAGYGSNDYIISYRAQLEELLTRYGELCEIWFDGANGGDGWYGGAKEKREIDRSSYYDFPTLWSRCRQIQPNAVLFSDAGPDIRWAGNECGVAGFTNWSRQRPEGIIPGDMSELPRLIHGDADGTVWRPSECDVSIRPGWFWHEQEIPKTADQLFGLWLASVGHGSSMLLNLAPDRRGLIPEQDIRELTEFRRRVQAFTAVDHALDRPVHTDAIGCGNPLALTSGGSWWATQPGTTTATIEVTLATAVPITGIRIEEEIRCGQRVEAFAVEAESCNAWTELARGTTIGAQRILRLPPFVTHRVRVRILSSQAEPVLKRIRVYGP